LGEASDEDENDAEEAIDVTEETTIGGSRDVALDAADSDNAADESGEGS
jgi:hypothetical protein